MSDCEALLAARDTLGGNLNWSDDRPMSSWSGVILNGSPARVYMLDLDQYKLNGQLSLELSKLNGLEYLVMWNNQLSGEIYPRAGQSPQAEIY